jgi:hypothetical protein
VTPETRKWIGRPGMVEAVRVRRNGWRAWQWRYVGLGSRTWFQARDAFDCVRQASWLCKLPMYRADWRPLP